MTHSVELLCGAVLQAHAFERLMKLATANLTRHDEFDAAAADKPKLVVMQVS